MKSLTVFVTTIGRTTLPRMLASLDDLREQDHLVVASDDLHNRVRSYITAAAADLRCSVHHVANSQRLGHWGHGSRNAHLHRLPGDWLLFADDDNRYAPGAIDMVRSVVTAGDQETAHLFRVQNEDKVYWNQPRVAVGNIDTGCGVVPNRPGQLPPWGMRYEGDGDFYVALAKQRPVEFHPHIIYLMRDTPCSTPPPAA